MSERKNASGHQKDMDVLKARIIIRYFPDIKDELFDSLSCFEQIFRIGPSFDSTGTPSFEGGRAMHDSFFVAGHMDLFIHSSKADVDLFCSAPNRWRDYRPDGLSLTDEKGKLHQIVSPGDVDRDFPGWDLSFFIFDKIVSSFCFVSGQKPRCAGAGSKPFVHYEIDAGQRIKTVYDTDITASAFGVCFSDGAGEGLLKERSASFADRFNEKDYTLIGVWESPDDIPAQWRRPTWWTIRTTHFHTDPDHVCSCYEDH